MKKKTGVLLILSILIFFSNKQAYSQESYFKVSDLRNLAIQFKKENKHFLSYIFNLSFYYISKDSSDKLVAGLDALDACINNDRFSEAEQMCSKLWNDFPQIKNQLMYKYGYSLLMSGRYVDGDIYLREIKLQDEKLENRIYLLRAFSKLNTNQPQKSLYYLNEIDENFPYYDKLNEIKTDLNKNPLNSKKYKYISVPLSMIIPGAGQVYCGFYFDAIQDFGFNLILGYASYASWKHELDYKRGDRNYVMPIISTCALGVFYLTNLFNAANSADKVNLYNENAYYSKILERFQIILKDKDYFFNLKFDL